jgi:hypothetical protein
MVREEPFVFVIHDFVSAAECDMLISMIRSSQQQPSATASAQVRSHDRQGPELLGTPAGLPCTRAARAAQGSSEGSPVHARCFARHICGCCLCIVT